MNPYGVDTTDSNLVSPLMSLKVLYDGMPQTSGCEKCAEVNGEDKEWCCRTQNPSMYYAEFLYVWREVQNWSKSQRAQLVLRSIRNYLDNSLNKGCIFYNEGCQVYAQRPFLCRLYGVIPKESWNQRWEALKERQKDKFCAKPQCSLVKSETPVTVEQENKWYAHTRTAEERIGVDAQALSLHDNPGGSYRTFHDHLLLETFPPSFLEYLTKVRMTNPSKEDIEKTLETVSEILEQEGIIK